MRVLTVTNMYPTARGSQGYRGSFVHEQVEALRAVAPWLHADVLVVDGPGGRLNYLRGVRQVAQAARQGRYDLVHAHYGLTGCVAAVATRLPLVVTFHGGDLNLAWQRPFSRFAARRCRVPIVVSPRLKALCGRDDAVVLPCGVDTELFRPMPKEEARRVLGLSEAPPLVLFPFAPGRPTKNFPLFQEAMTLVQQRRPDAAWLALDGRPHHQVPLLLNACDVAVLTSWSEGSPVVVKELLACTTPVVSVDVGDVAAQLAGVRHCHIVPYDAAHVAARVLEVLATGERSDGRARALALDVRVLARQLLELYRTATVSPAVTAAG